jgi:hypothetical protein
MYWASLITKCWFRAEATSEVARGLESLDHGEQPNEVGIAVARRSVV